MQIGVSGSLRTLAFGDLEVAHEQRVADGERGDVDLDVLGDVGRQHLDLELAEHVVEHAAEVAHAVGDADQVDGTRG